jgi:CHAD domain-containing protein
LHDSLLTGAARAILVDAQRALADTAPEAETVHELRKALKRWRALMRLLAEPVGEPARAMRMEARELMRALAGARDAQSALDAIDDLGKGEVPLPEASIATIKVRLTELRDAAEAVSFTPALRERLARYLEYATLSLERWPLAAIGADAISAGLAATYRRARQLVPENWPAAEPEHLHDLRRRVVDHRHQMDLVEPVWPRHGQAWTSEAQRLRNRLGACQDLFVLTEFTAPRHPLARWRARLKPAIEARRAAHLKGAARLCARLFADKPKVFRNRMATLLAARRTKARNSKT